MIDSNSEKKETILKDIISEENSNLSDPNKSLIDGLESDSSYSEQDYLDPTVNLNIPIFVNQLPKGYFANPDPSVKLNLNSNPSFNQNKTLTTYKENLDDSDDEDTGFYYVHKIQDKSIKRKNYPILSCIIAEGNNL